MKVRLFSQVGCNYLIKDHVSFCTSFKVNWTGLFILFLSVKFSIFNSLNLKRFENSILASQCVYCEEGHKMIGNC